MNDKNIFGHIFAYFSRFASKLFDRQISTVVEKKSYIEFKINGNSAESAYGILSSENIYVW